MPWTSSYSTKATYYLLPDFFRFCFQLPKVKLLTWNDVKCEMIVDGQSRGREPVPCPHCVGGKNAPFVLLYLKKS